MKIDIILLPHILLEAYTGLFDTYILTSYASGIHVTLYLKWKYISSQFKSKGSNEYSTYYKGYKILKRYITFGACKIAIMLKMPNTHNSKLISGGDVPLLCPHVYFERLVFFISRDDFYVLAARSTDTNWKWVMRHKERARLFRPIRKLTFS